MIITLNRNRIVCVVLTIKLQNPQKSAPVQLFTTKKSHLNLNLNVLNVQITNIKIQKIKTCAWNALQTLF